MSYSVSRTVVDAFYKAYATREVEKIAKFIHDDVEWTISGPVDYLPFCGRHSGKGNVIDLIKHKVPAVLRTFSFVPEAIVIDGDQVAMLSRQSAKRTTDGCTISYRVANIMRFRDGKVIENLSLIDSFDAVEQVLGQSLKVPCARAGDSELIAV